MSESNYCVYKHTSPSGKSYIGQTRDYNKRTQQHRARIRHTAFSNAIRKYGFDSFFHEILKDNLTLNEANYWEEFYINSHNTLVPNGYNLRAGGENRTASLEARRKMSLGRRLFMILNPDRENQRREKAIETLRSQLHRKRVSEHFKKWAELNPELAQDRIKKRTETFNSPKNKELNSIRNKNWIENNPEKAKERQEKATIAKNKPEAIEANRLRALKQWSNEENKKRMSEIKRKWHLENAISWVLINPNGNFIITNNLKEFCLLNGLSYKALTDKKNNKSKGFIRLGKLYEQN